MTWNVDIHTKTHQHLVDIRIPWTSTVWFPSFYAFPCYKVSHPGKISLNLGMSSIYVKCWFFFTQLCECQICGVLEKVLTSSEIWLTTENLVSNLAAQMELLSLVQNSLSTIILNCTIKEGLWRLRLSSLNAENIHCVIEHGFWRLRLQNRKCKSGNAKMQMACVKSIIFIRKYPVYQVCDINFIIASL